MAPDVGSTGAAKAKGKRTFITILLHAVNTSKRLSTDDIKQKRLNLDDLFCELVLILKWPFWFLGAIRQDGLDRVGDGLPRACPARGIIGHSCSYATASAIERDGIQGAHQRRRDPDGDYSRPCLGQSLYN